MSWPTELACWLWVMYISNTSVLHRSKRVTWLCIQDGDKATQAIGALSFLLMYTSSDLVVHRMSE
jgi:hypothetical protein